MKKRTFIKNLSVAALTMPFSFHALDELLKTYDHLDEKTFSSSEEFWKQIRSDYRLKPDYINLESGYYNIMPQSTLNKMFELAQMVNYEGSHYMRTVQWENKKRMVQKLSEVVGCGAENLVITRNTTESLDLIIKGFPWKAGDEAVYAQQDYGAMRNMFAQVSKRYGVKTIIVSVPNHPTSDDEIVELYANAITPNTKLLMICHMINITGQILPVQKICRMAHQRGVQVMVDGAHCTGHFDFNIRDLECDYYGASLHKWLAVPLGTGLLYVQKENIDNIWPIFAESPKEPGDILRLNHTGTHPVYHDLSIETAIEYYIKIGPKRKEDRLRYLQEYWTSKVRNQPKIIVNTPIESQRACGIANVGIEGMPPGEMAKTLLDKYKIFTVAIDYANVHGCRVTPNVFTLTHELDAFVEALNEMAV